MGEGFSSLNERDYLFKYNSSSPPSGSLTIPFDNYSTSYNSTGLNERHISFNTHNGDWLALELNTVSGDEDIFNGTFICDLVNLGIQGSDNVCDTGVFLYLVVRAPTRGLLIVLT